MKVLFTSSEAFPFSKTGGLADMAFFLPKSLIQLGHEVRIITPYYKQIQKNHSQMKMIGSRTIRMGGIETIVNYFRLIHQGIEYIFVQNMHYFERETLYGYNDDAERFTCFSYAVLEVMDLLDDYPHILHLNDWQTGMIPYLLDEHYRQKNDHYYSIHTLLTIHNLEYQGSFDPYVSRFFNTYFNYTYIHFDRVNFLKAGIERATKLNTVSPTYRNEVMTPEYGFSLDGALGKRHHDFVGILNGIDDDVFNPQTDHLIHFPYSIRNFVSGKQKNKEDLLRHFNLSLDMSAPLIAYVGRLATQKGINLMTNILEEVIEYSNARFVLMGSGNDSYEDYFRYLSAKYPDRVANYIGFNEQMAHKIYATSDLYMKPSRFEPCGLGQMIAMKYGSLPIVRETGGLKDTVNPFNRYTGDGTGFTFANYDAYELKEKLFESIYVYNHDQKAFKDLVRQAMKQDYSLKQMALSYEKIYQIILGV
ncbi:MAG: glycogen/starch synthase [Acholeplasmataceae bacterium]|jgi:starch synthase|nr:glycogen/starch synthase [Acholeplasmataceae bacterium]